MTWTYGQNRFSNEPSKIFVHKILTPKSVILMGHFLLNLTCVWPESAILPYFTDPRWSELIKRSLSYFSDFNLPWVNNESIPINLVGSHFSILVLSDTVNGHLRVFNWFALFWCIWIQKRNGLFSTLWSKKSQINAPLTMSGARNPASTAINPLPEGLPFYYHSVPGYTQKDSVEGFEPWE